LVLGIYFHILHKLIENSKRVLGRATILRFLF